MLILQPRTAAFHACVFAALLLLIPVFDGAGAHAQELRRTGKAWLDMDYGPFKETTVEAPRPEGNFAYKGLAIRLGGKRDAAVVFDKDTLRFSAAWTGGWLNLTGVVYDGQHWAYPSTNGPIAYSNTIGPGWASPDANADAEAAFKDVRFVGSDNKRYGPLPRGWAHWKGLYVHADSVVLSYTVGDTRVLELPGVEDVGDLTIFTRTLNVAPSAKELTVQLAHEEQRCDVLHLRQLLPVESPTRDPRQTMLVFGLRGEAAPKEDDRLKKGLTAHFTFDAVINNHTVSDVDKKTSIRIDDAQPAEGVKDGAIQLDEKTRAELKDKSKVNLSLADHTIAAWIKTNRDGTIIAQAPAEGNWAPQGRTFFIRGGRLCFDIGWVGVIQSRGKVADDKWRHVAVTFAAATKTYTLYIDGKDQGSKRLDVDEAVKEHVIRIGYTSPNFPGRDNRFRGLMDDLRIYNRALSKGEVHELATGEAAPAEVLAIACVTDAEVSWKEKDHDARLAIAAHDKPARIKILTWRGPQEHLPAFATTVRAAKPPVDLTPLTKGGPTRWKDTLLTQAKLGEPRKGSPYAIDTLTWPADNPWNSWLRFGGFDFFRDGKHAAICTWSGDVWMVSGIAPGEKLSELRWRRIASGMFQPLGVKIVDENIYITCRDQITRLVDLNGDGETDYYENFNNDHQVTEHFHEFAMDLQTDASGNFYYAKSARHARDSLIEQHGTLIRVSPDGKRSQIIANGYRAANGVGVGPRGEFFTSDQEGHWMPANRINLVREGSFSGNMFSYHRGEKPDDYDRPIVWLPKGIDRSPAAQVWVGSDKWGLPKGSLISLSYGTGYIQHVMYEMVEGLHPRVYVQGAFHRLPVQFPTGVMRGRFHPDDGQLYACGLFGWSSNQTLPGGFYRVRYVGGGEPIVVPTKFLAATDGVVLRFSAPIDAELGADADSYLIEQWDYKWTGNYGSPEFKLSDGNKGRDKVGVKAAHVSKDKRSVWLEIPSLKPSMQIRIKYDLDTAEGEPLADDVYGSIHVMPKRSGAKLLNGE